MRTIGLMFLLVTATIAWCDDKPKKSEFTGAWEIASASFDGKDNPALKGRKLVFDETEFTTYDGEKQGRTVSFTLDAKATPKQIDLERPDAKKALGIVVIEKDEMKICYSEPGADRPKKFESKEGDKLFLLVLKRAKKE